MDALFIPATSPSSLYRSSTLYLLRSPYLMNIRSSMSAQSWDSVPPAPGWIVIMALLSSYSPLSSIARRKPLISLCNSKNELATSFSFSVVGSSSAISNNTSKSSTNCRVFSRLSTFSFTVCDSLIIFWAFCWSCQKPSSFIKLSSRLDSDFSEPRSKRVADFDYLPSQLGVFCFNFVEISHLYLFSLLLLVANN